MDRRYQAMTESATERTAAGALGADALDFRLGHWHPLPASVTRER